MIPAWMLKRAGEVESFLKLLHKEHQLRPSLEIYQTNNGAAIGINYEHPFFHELELKLKRIMVDEFFCSSSFDAEKKEISSLYHRWNAIASWREYKANKAAGGSWSDSPRVWYCSDVEENDIEQLRELYDWIDGGFTQEEFALLKKFADVNKGKKEDADFQQLSKAIDELLEDRDLQWWFYDIKQTICLVESLCEVIDKERMQSIAQMLKLPLKSISETPEIAEAFLTIKKLQNLTSKNIELVDAYDELSALVRGRQTFGYKQPMRRAKSLLEELIKSLKRVDVTVELQEQTKQQ